MLVLNTGDLSAVIRTLIVIIGVLIAAAAAPALAATLGRPLTVPADTPAWIIVVVAGAAALLAIVLARALSLPDAARRLLAPRRPLEQVFADLADIAQIARDDGLLPAATDPRAAAHPMLVSGLHLLIRDPDERLVRSAIEAEEDRTTHQAGDTRALAAAACRWGSLAALLAGGSAAVLMTLRLSSPWSVASPAAVQLLGLVAGSIVWLCIGGRLAEALLRRNAESEVLAHAAKVAVLAVHARFDRDQTLARLSRLLPTDPAEVARGTSAARKAA